MSNITSACPDLQAEQEVPTHLSDGLPIVAMMRVPAVLAGQKHAWEVQHG